MTTQVKFLYHEGNEDLFAFFPFECWNSDKITKTSYSKLGQHSACCDGYAKESREATKEEAKELQNELLSIGYKINILNSWAN